MTTNCVSIAAARRWLPQPAERRAIRQAAGLSLRQVGRDLGVTPQCVALWETGHREPRGGNLLAYIDVLVELDELASTEEMS